MAYGTIYTANWGSKEREGVVTILKKDYGGSPTFTLRLKADSLEYGYNFRGWDDHIVGMNASFAFQNTSAAMSSHLLALMNAEEQEYKVRITETSPSSRTLFEGYMNNELIEQPYVGYSSLTLTASSYLSKLQHNHPTSIDTLQNLSFIDLIDDILTQTGAAFNIKVNCSLYETSFPIVGNRTLFNLYGVYTELFWENNIDRKSGVDILQTILSTFECYLYWFDGYWYIERYEDLWRTFTQYKRYTTGVSYAPGDTAAALVDETVSSSDLHDLVFTGLSQTLSTRPGKNKVEISLSENKLYNLTINDFTDAVEIDSVPYALAVGLRQWKYYDTALNAWPSKGIQFKNISNGINRVGAPTEYLVGLFTKIRVEVGDDTALNIKWKWAASAATSIIGNFVDPEDTTFTFRYILKTGGEFIIYDSGDEQWELTSGANSYAQAYFQEFTVNGSEFDLDLYTYDAQVNIPLAEVVGLSAGQHDIIVVIGMESIETSSDGPEAADNCVIGDVKITVNEDFPDNHVEGTVSNDYLETLKLSMDLFDLANWNYKNGVLCDTDFETLSEEWADGDSTDTLARMKLISKWRQNHRTMQKIKGEIYNSTRLKPFQVFSDSEQATRDFVLGSFTDMVDRDKKRIEIVEYDNSETITLA